MARTQKSLLEISEALSNFPRPKDINGSYKAKEDIVRLIREWERINNGDYNPVMKKAALMKSHPEVEYQTFRGYVNLDVDQMALPDLEVRSKQVRAEQRDDQVIGIERHRRW